MLRSVLVFCLLCVFSNAAWCDEKEDKIRRIENKFDKVAWGKSQSLTDNVLRILRQIGAQGMDVDVYRRRHEELKFHVNELEKKGIDLAKDDITFGLIEWTETVKILSGPFGEVRIPKDHKIKFYIGANCTWKDNKREDPDPVNHPLIAVAKDGDVGQAEMCKIKHVHNGQWKPFSIDAFKHGTSVIRIKTKKQYYVTGIRGNDHRGRLATTAQIPGGHENFALELHAEPNAFYIKQKGNERYLKVVNGIVVAPSMDKQHATLFKIVRHPDDGNWFAIKTAAPQRFITFVDGGGLPAIP